jgi:hypothetical protein
MFMSSAFIAEISTKVKTLNANGHMDRPGASEEA